MESFGKVGKWFTLHGPRVCDQTMRNLVNLTIVTGTNNGMRRAQVAREGREVEFHLAAESRDGFIAEEPQELEIKLRVSGARRSGTGFSQRYKHCKRQLRYSSLLVEFARGGVERVLVRCKVRLHTCSESET